MSKYSELIKRFDKVRDYMNDFYIYGFKSREAFDKKSLRSYDNERRRIESYLVEYMSFTQDENGKNIFIEADCSEIKANPLYRAFKAKSFTKNDITLHFIILDILRTQSSLSVIEIADIILDEYLNKFESPTILDVSTIRKKVIEYEKLGIVISRKDGKQRYYSLSEDTVDVAMFHDALVYFSEVSLMGVIGSYMLDKGTYENEYFRFKHHYIMHALESEVMYDILQAIHHKQVIRMIYRVGKDEKELVVTPLKFLISVQSGRRYISVSIGKQRRIMNFRLDAIQRISMLRDSLNFDRAYQKLEMLLKHTWGTSFGDGKRLETIVMQLRIPHHERYMIRRIEKEGRHGVLTQLRDELYEYVIEVYDSIEMMPWIRTFIGRIVSLEGSNKRFVDLFYNDLHSMQQMYRGE